MKSQRMVLIALMLTLGSGAISFYIPDPYRRRTIWGKEHVDSGAFPPMRFFIGVGIVFFGISAVSEFKPQLGGPFAALVGTTALLYNGIPAIEYLVNGGGQPSKTEKGMATPSNTDAIQPPARGSLPTPAPVAQRDTAVTKKTATRRQTIVLPQSILDSIVKTFDNSRLTPVQPYEGHEGSQVILP